MQITKKDQLYLLKKIQKMAAKEYEKINTKKENEYLKNIEKTIKTENARQN